MAGVKIAGVPDLKAMIARARKAGQAIGLMEAVSQRLQERMGLRFDTKKDPEGKPWRALAPSTRLVYQRQDELTGNGGRQGTLLERTGLMRASLTRQIFKRDVTVGFASEYAVHHETGTEHMARRGLIFSDPVSGRLAERDITEMEATAREWMEGELTL